MQNKNLTVISPTYTSTLKSIIYSGKRLSQLINSSAHGKLQLGAISTIRKLEINRRKTERESNYRKDQKPKSRKE